MMVPDTQISLASPPNHKTAMPKTAALDTEQLKPVTTPVTAPLTTPVTAPVPSVMPGKVLTDATATVRLGAVQRNYKSIVNCVKHGQVAAAIKADGYGLGAVAIAQALWLAGCREFFVAQLDEGIVVRKALPHATINVLSGLMPGTERQMIEYRLTPTIISLQQLKLWQQQAYHLGTTIAAGLHIDSGMHRTGLPTKELALLLEQPERLNGVSLNHVISHLASADHPGSAQPEQQLQHFQHCIQALPAARTSIANSAGIYRGSEFHLDFVRPGIALYGGNPQPAQPNPMEATVALEAPILQIVNVSRGDSIGYGASYTADSAATHAIIAAGYADGVLRSASGTGQVAIGNQRCPIVGRISMDVTTVDVTAIPNHLLYPGAPVEFIGNNISLDDAAAAAGTISYEMLTGIGNRFKRHYTQS